MNIFIVEDEIVTQMSLVRILNSNFPEVKVVGTARTVKESLEYLRANESTPPDLIFMDVELQDGNCFDIFRQINITSNVVLTTAYHKYAIEAFRVGCIDYLLKPIEPQALCRSVERCKKNMNIVNSKNLLATFDQFVKNKPMSESGKTKKRFIIKLGDNFVLVPTTDIAYFYTVDNATYLVTKQGVNYIINYPLDVIITQIDLDEFFRISRYCIIALSEISGVTKIKGGRLKILTKFEPKCEMTVSRARVEEFLDWLA